MTILPATASAPWVGCPFTVLPFTTRGFLDPVAATWKGLGDYVFQRQWSLLYIVPVPWPWEPRRSTNTITQTRRRPAGFPVALIEATLSLITEVVGDINTPYPRRRSGHFFSLARQSHICWHCLFPSHRLLPQSVASIPVMYHWVWYQIAGLRRRWSSVLSYLVLKDQQKCARALKFKYRYHCPTTYAKETQEEKEQSKRKFSRDFTSFICDCTESAFCI